MLPIQEFDISLFSFELLEEAKQFNGRRVELRKLVDQGMKAAELLDAHTQVMLDNKSEIVKGMLFKATWEGKSIHLLGCCHKRMGGPEELPQEEEMANNYIVEIIHPVVMEILGNSNLYVELVKNAENVEKIIRYSLENGLLVSSKQQKRTDFIENTLKMKMNNCGLDYAVSHKQFRNQKKYDSIETIEEQLAFMKGVADFQLENPPHFYLSAEACLEGLDAVQWGNLESLILLDKEMPEQMLTLFALRDTKIEERVFNKLCSGESALFALGGSHIAGIISLLQKRGVQVERMIY